ncbi:MULTISPECIES: hypothetical protein [unclassified Thiocapsa]|uniref:hypothetical protein n=1 Tax=unclassified Thiocapsa TaxID=2641286 RepID=UPI0035B04406
MSKKPNLGLIEGKEVLDLESLRQMYINLTGKEPTAEELDETNAMLKATKAETADKLRPRA